MTLFSFLPPPPRYHQVSTCCYCYILMTACHSRRCVITSYMSILKWFTSKVIVMIFLFFSQMWHWHRTQVTGEASWPWPWGLITFTGWDELSHLNTAVIAGAKTLSIHIIWKYSYGVTISIQPLTLTKRDLSSSIWAHAYVGKHHYAFPVQWKVLKQFLCI